MLIFLAGCRDKVEVRVECVQPRGPVEVHVDHVHGKSPIALPLSARGGKCQKRSLLLVKVSTPPGAERVEVAARIGGQSGRAKVERGPGVEALEIPLVQVATGA